MMKSIPLEDVLFEGAVSLERGDGWVRPWRLPFADLDLFTPSQQGLVARARETAGVRLRFETDAEDIELCFQPPDPAPVNPTHTLDLTMGDDWRRTVNLAAGATQARFEALPAGQRIVELWLPHDAGIAITGLRINDGAAYRPSPDPRPRWITYGSSLTHSRRAHSPARTWPAIVARRKGLNLICLGYGGNCCLEPIMGTIIRDLPADVITLKLGINCISGALAPRTFGPAVMGLVRAIREKKPQIPMGLISPIAYPPRERDPNVLDNTITKMREDIVDVAARLQRRGDTQLVALNGLDVFNEAEIAAYAADQCHPNGDGIELMAEHFLERIWPKIPVRFSHTPPKPDFA